MIMKKYAIWGLGHEFDKKFDLLDPELNIVCLIDRDVEKQGKNILQKIYNVKDLSQ